MSQHDSGFYKPFIWVLGALVVFTFFIAIVANIYSPKNDYSTDDLVQQGVKKQIAPVGSSRVAERAPAATAQPAAEVVTEAVEEAPVKAEAPAEAEATEETVAEGETEKAAEVADTTDATVETGDAVAATTDTEADAAEEQVAVVETAPAPEAVSAIATNEVPLKVRAVVATNCAGCHQEGVKGAQRSDDKAAWQALAAKGLDELTASVINGKGEMLPRAETSLNDEEIALAVRYMVTQSTGESVGEAPAESAAPAAAIEEDSSASTEEAAEKPDDAPAVESTASSTESATATVTETETTEPAVVEEVEPVAAAGSVPANVQAVSDGLCAGCHLSGVANAPKIGDKAAWEERMAGGMDALLASVIAGKGVMPARGGSQLSDAELRIAIEYLANKE